MVDGLILLKGSAQSSSLLQRVRKPCVSEVSGVDVSWTDQKVSSVGHAARFVSRGDTITMDGSTGYIYLREMSLVGNSRDEYFQKVVEWAQKYKKLRILATLHGSHDLAIAQHMGADGIGLVKTEWMFQGDDRADLFRKFILTESKEERVDALVKLQPLHQADFLNLFKGVGNSKHINIRLFSHPFHEYLPDPKDPNYENELTALSAILGVPPDRCQTRIDELQETNPLLGFRGSRVLVAYPELVEMQTSAIVGS